MWEGKVETENEMKQKGMPMELWCAGQEKVGLKRK